jgi:hypothetical protein
MIIKKLKNESKKRKCLPAKYQNLKNYKNIKKTESSEGLPKETDFI